MNCRDSGILTEMEWNIYCDWHSYLLRSLGGLRLDAIVYLRADPQVGVPTSNTSPK